MGYRITTNDIALEQAKQASVANAENRLAKLRNRVARAKDPKLVAIALVAKERGDRTIEKEARQRLGLEKGTKLADAVEIVESRRLTRSAQYRELVDA